MRLTPSHFYIHKTAFELLIAGALWGFGFVATHWALNYFSVFETLSLRFIIAFFMGELLRHGLHTLNKISKVPVSYVSASSKPIFSLKFSLQTLKEPLLGGFFLGSMLLFQTIGLETTTATKNSFITCLYVVLVPLLQSLRDKTLIFQWTLWRNTGLSLLGLMLLLGNPFTGWSEGDFWTLLCAFFAAFHILYIEKISHKIKDPFFFNNFQSLFSIGPLIPLGILQIHENSLFEASHNLSADALNLSLFGVLFLALGSSTLAFAIQIRAQRKISSTTASMFFLLESPFAFLFSWIFLNEKLTFLQGLGALFIIGGSFLMIKWESSIQKIKKQLS